MKIIVVNAFSASMLPTTTGSKAPYRGALSANTMAVEFRPFGSAGDASDWLAEASRRGANIVSAIGHADTATIVSRDLHFQLDSQRISVRLGPGVEMLLAQYSGPRLPEGAMTLPEGARIEYYYVLDSTWELLNQRA